MVLKSFNLVLERYWKSMENCFWIYVWTLVLPKRLGKKQCWASALDS